MRRYDYDLNEAETAVRLYADETGRFLDYESAFHRAWEYAQREGVEVEDETTGA